MERMDEWMDGWMDDKWLKEEKARIGKSRLDS